MLGNFLKHEFDCFVRKAEDNQHELQMNLEDRFAQTSGREKGQKGDEQVSAGQPGQIEEGIGDRGHQRDRDEGVLLHVSEQRGFQFFDKSLKLAQVFRG